MPTTAESNEIIAIIASGETAADGVLERIFDALQPVRPEAMIGSWRGGAFGGEDAAAGMLERIGWHGKRFHDAEHVEPLICRDEGGKLYSYEKLGLARLREISFRGKASAAMVYDTQPIIDHFRLIDADRVLGLMDVKGTPPGFYFHLTREAA